MATAGVPHAERLQAHIGSSASPSEKTKVPGGAPSSRKSSAKGRDFVCLRSRYNLKTNKKTKRVSAAADVRARRREPR